MARARTDTSEGPVATGNQHPQSAVRRDEEAFRPGEGSTTRDREWGQESSPDMVARRAYEIYCERGCEHGRDMDDWFEAERELNGRTE